jgi:hypothetical protein
MRRKGVSESLVTSPALSPLKGEGDAMRATSGWIEHRRDLDPTVWRTSAAKLIPTPASIHRAPSPLNGERAGVGCREPTYAKARFFGLNAPHLSP